jgi:hypothetical protein
MLVSSLLRPPQPSEWDSWLDERTRLMGLFAPESENVFLTIPPNVMPLDTFLQHHPAWAQANAYFLFNDSTWKYNITVVCAICMRL